MYGGKIEGYVILVTETLTIQKAVQTIIQEILSNVIIESDSVIATQAINGEFNCIVDR